MDTFEEEASSGDEVNNEESIYTVSDPVLDITTSSNPESFALRRGGAVDDLSQYGLDESNTKEENEPDETDIAEMSHIAQEIEDAEDFDLTIEIVDPAKSFIGVADPGDSTDSDTKIGGGEIATNANRVLPEFSPRPRHRRTSASSSGRRSAERRRSESLEKKRSLSRSSGRESVEKRRSGSKRRSGEVKEEPTQPAAASSEKKQKSPRNADAEIDRHQRPSEEKENYKTPKRPASSFGCKKPSEKRRSGSLANSLLMEWSEKKTPSATLGLKVSKHHSPSVAQKLLADWSPNPVQDCTIVTAEDRAQDRNSTSTSRKREMPVTAVPSRDAKSKRSL